MSIRKEVMQIITKAIDMPITDMHKQLNQNLGLDSLSFILLLLAIEDRFSITFDISEMESCLDINQLIELIEEKVKGEDKRHA